ncbi:MAG: metallophosphoesterase [Chryseolinea sp.]
MKHIETANTFVVGDIHGGYHALRQCMERSSFSIENDHLICLGDVCDGWPDTKMCVDELLKLGMLTYIMGNHDLIALEWMLTGNAPESWIVQGGQATVEAYRDGVPPLHLQFFKQAHPFVVLNDCLFVHAGIDPSKDLADQGQELFLWDRTLARKTLEALQRNDHSPLTKFKEVYIGHTPISGNQPLTAGGVWMMDTGAGWSGVLSMMNVNTKETFVSDPVPSLYPGVAGRAKRG